MSSQTRSALGGITTLKLGFGAFREVEGLGGLEVDD
jgi:hypothetical protein